MHASGVRAGIVKGNMEREGEGERERKKGGEKGKKASGVASCATK